MKGGDKSSGGREGEKGEPALETKAGITFPYTFLRWHLWPQGPKRASSPGTVLIIFTYGY